MTPHLASQTAKYHQLSRYLQQQIVAGEMPPNQQLPTEDVLTQQFNVSRGTVRKAVDLLASQGLVRREQGRGTFVNDNSEQGPAGFTLGDFANEMYRQQREPSTQVLVQDVQRASAEIAQTLAINPSDPIIYISRLRLADQRPIIFEERYLPQALCPALADEDVVTQSIHWLLVHKYKLPLVKVTHTVERREVGVDSAETLQLSPTDQIFAVHRLTYTKRNGKTQPAVYYRANCHGSEYQFKAQFNAMI